MGIDGMSDCGFIVQAVESTINPHSAILNPQYGLAKWA